MTTTDKHRAAAERIWPQIAEWLRELGDDPDADRDTAIEHVAKAIRIGWGDGYKAARQLENDGWDPDARLVEILDGVMG